MTAFESLCIRILFLLFLLLSLLAILLLSDWDLSFRRRPKSLQKVVEGRVQQTFSRVRVHVYTQCIPSILSNHHV
jgi:hypothetical protein